MTPMFPPAAPLHTARGVTHPETLDWSLSAAGIDVSQEVSDCIPCYYSLASHSVSISSRRRCTDASSATLDRDAPDAPSAYLRKAGETVIVIAGTDFIRGLRKHPIFLYRVAFRAMHSCG